MFVNVDNKWVSIDENTVLWSLNILVDKSIVGSLFIIIF